MLNKMKALIKLTFLVLLPNVIALKFFKSNKNDIGEKIISGLHYKSKYDDKRPVLSNSLTVCVRFNIERYGVRKNPAQILWLGYKQLFFGLRVNYPLSGMILVNSNNGNEFSFFRLLYDSKRKNYPMWKVHIWHHVCFSYSNQNSHISFVKVMFYMSKYSVLKM